MKLRFYPSLNLSGPGELLVRELRCVEHPRLVHLQQRMPIDGEILETNDFVVCLERGRAEVFTDVISAAEPLRKLNTRPRSPKPGDPRWCTDIAALTTLPPHSEAWLLLDGSPQPVRYNKPLTAEQAAAMGVLAWSRALVTENLSFIEREVFLELARGKGTMEIAKARGNDHRTISEYLARIRTKTGLANKTEIIVYAHRHGLVEWGPLPQPSTTWSPENPR